MNISVRMLQLKGRTHELVRRFPVAVFWQTVGFFIAAGAILMRPGYDIPSFWFENSVLFDRLTQLVPAVIAAWLAAATGSLLRDAFPVKKAPIVTAVCSAALFLILAYLWYGIEAPSRHLIMGTLGVYLALSFLALFFLEHTNRAPGLPALLFAAVFSITTSILLFLGLMLCVAAFWALIITDTDGWLPETTYLFAGLIAYGVWGLGAFLGALPRAGERYEHSVAVQKLLLYLFFPVYAVLLLVLYIYVGKIILAGDMPVGIMNWYASFALLGFTFFFGTLAAQKRLPLFSRFLEWGFFILLPIIAVQIYGVCLRYAAYGLTTARYASMICTFCGIYALVVAFLKKKPQQVYLCAALLALIFSLTPLNVIDVPLHNQEARLNRILTEYNLLQDGQIVKRNDTPSHVVNEIIDIAQYIGRNASPLAAAVLDADFKPIHEFFSFYGPNSWELSVVDYHTLIHFGVHNINNKSTLVLTRTDGTTERIDLRSHIEMLLQNNTHTSEKLQDYETENYLVHFENISIARDKDGSIIWNNAEGFVLIR
ncbi:MAG: DUF4153 domain-containing protein [Selenomonas noxia]|uniref:DUF4153 domain-containing protein n=1 Tax=Selenomonas noxia TaxID=135083 RepID=UPI0032C1D60E